MASFRLDCMSQKLWCEITGDVEEQLRGIGGVCADRAAGRWHDRHVRCNATVQCVQCGYEGLRCPLWPQRQVAERTWRHNRCVEHVGLRAGWYAAPAPRHIHAERSRERSGILTC